MNTPLIKAFVFLLFFVTTLPSCKKNKEEDVPVSEVTIAGTYTLASYIETSLLLGEKDLLAEMDECKRDDEYVLHEDKSFQYNDVGAVCAIDGSRSGSWILIGENLTFLPFTGKIEKLSNKQLILTFDAPVLGLITTKRAVFNRK